MKEKEFILEYCENVMPNGIESKETCNDIDNGMVLENSIYNELNDLDDYIADYNFTQFEKAIRRLLEKVTDKTTRNFLLDLLEEELDNSVHWIIPANLIYQIKKNIKRFV